MGTPFKGSTFWILPWVWVVAAVGFEGLEFRVSWLCRSSSTGSGGGSGSSSSSSSSRRRNGIKSSTSGCLVVMSSVLAPVLVLMLVQVLPYWPR